MANKVLTLEEVLALETGQRVWIEHKPDAWAIRVSDGAAVVMGHAYWGKVLGKRGREDYDFYGLSTDNDVYFGRMFRVWHKKPTPDELAAWPWEVEHEQ